MYMHELYQRERHADFVRQAEQELIVLAVTGGKRKPFYRPALAAVGVKLVALGNRLQDNVENVTPMQMVSSGERA